MGDVLVVIWAIERLSVPAPASCQIHSVCLFLCVAHATTLGPPQTYSGKIMFDRIPPAHGCCGK
jgi:hypothetical protein